MTAASRLFKYFSSSVLHAVLPDGGGAVFKCSYPKDFNDPYELFLSINLDESPELLAFYADVVGEIAQLPTTCFSRSPSVLPMWAHYAQNQEGFVLELDETAIVARYEEAGFGDVDYRDAPDPELNSLLAHAHQTTKPRHTHFLRNAVFSAAYYTKASCWSYEQERRMLVADGVVRREGNMMLLDIPASAVSRLICGPRAGNGTRTHLMATADRLSIPYLELRISKSSPIPHFKDRQGRVWQFRDGAFVQAGQQCASCEEPISCDAELCSLCRISDRDLADASRRNPFRMLHRYGMLQDYVKEMRELDRRGRESE